MARFVKRRSSFRTKRKTKWCAAAFDFQVPNQGNLTAADGVNLCIQDDAVHDQADPVIGWCKGSISLTRIGVAVTNPSVAWAIVMGRLNTASGVVVQNYNPWDISDLERQDVLGTGQLEVPPIVVKADDSEKADRGNRVTDINIKVSRKFNRNTNGLFLWVVAIGASDNNYQASGFVRSLMKF